MRVAVVRNMSRAGVISAFGAVSGELYREQTAEAVAGALREAGHRVAVFEGDKHLLSAVERFLAGNGQPGGMVFNLAGGIQGEAPCAHVPAMLEMAGVPYTGAGPIGHALCADVAATHALLKDAGIATPRGCLMGWSCDALSAWSWPLSVRPRRPDPTFGSRVVWNAEQLRGAIDEVATRCEQDAFVLEHREGVRLSASLLGNDPDVWLSVTDLSTCRPARLEPWLADRVRAIALGACRICGCQDYACITLRVGNDGRPLVVGVDPMPTLHREGPYARAAAASGVEYDLLIARILDVTHYRYFGVPAPRFHSPALGRYAASVVVDDDVS